MSLMTDCSDQASEPLSRCSPMLWDSNSHCNSCNWRRSNNCPNHRNCNLRLNTHYLSRSLPLEHSTKIDCRNCSHCLLNHSCRKRLMTSVHNPTWSANCPNIPRNRDCSSPRRYHTQTSIHRIRHCNRHIPSHHIRHRPAGYRRVRKWRRKPTESPQPGYLSGPRMQNWRSKPTLKRVLSDETC